MSKQTVKIAIELAIKTLAANYKVSEVAIVDGLEAGHANLTEQFSRLLKTGFEVGSGFVLKLEAV